MKNAKNQLNKSLRALLLAVLFAVSTFAGVRVGFAAYSSVQNVKRVVQLSKGRRCSVFFKLFVKIYFN